MVMVPRKHCTLGTHDLCVSLINVSLCKVFDDISKVLDHLSEWRILHQLSPSHSCTLDSDMDKQEPRTVHGSHWIKLLLAIGSNERHETNSSCMGKNNVACVKIETNGITNFLSFAVLGRFLSYSGFYFYISIIKLPSSIEAAQQLLLSVSSVSTKVFEFSL